MSVKTISKDSIDRMMSTAISGDLHTAFAVLNQSGLTQDQKAKIAAILKVPHSDMQQRIVAVVGEENIATAAASSEQTPSEQGWVSFADVSTSPFGNAYPCTFEFGGKHYQNATACFLAQQYDDLPEIMDLFTDLNPEDAAALAEHTPMTKERTLGWENPHGVYKYINKDDVLMYVLRAKFGQNPELKNQLLETGADYLVCHGRGLFMSDNMNGTGKNALGASLMLLRGEYGGTGQVAPPPAYQSETQGLQTRCQSITNTLCQDIMGLFLNCYFSQGDFTTLTAVACVNKYWNNFSTNFWAAVDLKQLCPELNILDAKAQGVECGNEPKITKLRLLKWIREISPHVEESAGVTQLTMLKGTTLNQLIEIAKGEGMTVNVEWDRIIKELGNVPVEQTYGILITNNVFVSSRKKGYNAQNRLVKGHGCKMPTVQEYVALCVYTNKVYKKCLYGQNPRTYGRSSTLVKNNENKYPLTVGESTPARLDVSRNNWSAVYVGAGGRKKFIGPLGSFEFKN